MPHVTLEYSANLESDTNILGVCRLLNRTMLDSGLFELGAVRVRAMRADTYAIADEKDENAFLDVSVRIGVGRADDEKKRLGELLIAALTRALSTRLTSPHFALSLEIREIDPHLNWKLNSIHARLRKSRKRTCPHLMKTSKKPTSTYNALSKAAY